LSGLKGPIGAIGISGRLHVVGAQEDVNRMFRETEFCTTQQPDVGARGNTDGWTYGVKATWWGSSKAVELCGDEHRTNRRHGGAE
jgi:hypothetical protein